MNENRKDFEEQKEIKREIEAEIMFKVCKRLKEISELLTEKIIQVAHSRKIRASIDDQQGKEGLHR